MSEREERTAAQQLGETYAALVGGQDWQVDAVPDPTVDDVPVALPAAPTDGPLPPLAEAVVDATVPPSPLQIVEALLFVGGPPLTPEQATHAVRGLTPERFRECVDALNGVYRSQNRPYSVVHSPSGYVMRVGSRFAAVREKLYGGPREARLTQPALDVLSLVAYRQPIAKAEIDAARGSDSAGTLRQLVRLGLVASGPTGDYATTAKFLEVFRLRSLEELPELGESSRVE